jgi:hypothetical protein
VQQLSNTDGGGGSGGPPLRFAQDGSEPAGVAHLLPDGRRSSRQMMRLMQ